MQSTHHPDFNNADSDAEDDLWEEEEGESKSERKRQSEALQDLGVTLAELSESELQQFDLPDNLHRAILDLNSITSRSASKRHRQYIGKLMRGVYADPILQRLAIQQQQQQL
ncbi:MAG: DUF615 domain-containing protein, partial [Gammaproteobacteria bacterium]|nr:DUF615 domain-containing protein [Gammaproteobacteria bacterium]